MHLLKVNIELTLLEITEKSSRKKHIIAYTLAAIFAIGYILLVLFENGHAFNRFLVRTSANAVLLIVNCFILGILVRKLRSFGIYDCEKAV